MKLLIHLLKVPVIKSATQTGILTDIEHFVTKTRN